MTTSPADLDDESIRLAAAISEAARTAGCTVSVAESLTSGSLACHLGAAEAASEWFAGGVIAYSKQVKFTVLGVEPGPVVTDPCARQMAAGVAKLTSADFAVAVTGVGGPEPDEGRPAGTVFVAVASAGGTTVEEHRFDGDPGDVLRATTVHALRLLHSRMQSEAPAVG